VLAWRTDFLRELLGGGQCAVLVDAGDDEALGEGLSALIKNREYREGVGEMARKRILARFGVSSLVCRMSEAYEEVLGMKRERAS
jgi:glycosyltransferase involved in cell wall biosynthesis